MVSYRKNVTGVDNTVYFATRYDAAQLAHQDGNLAFRLCAGGGFGGLGGNIGNPFLVMPARRRHEVLPGIIAAPATSLGGLRAKALRQAPSITARSNFGTTARPHDRCSMRSPK
jgi:hypothetical protein